MAPLVGHAADVVSPSGDTALAFSQPLPRRRDHALRRQRRAVAARRSAQRPEQPRQAPRASPAADTDAPMALTPSMAAAAAAPTRAAAAASAAAHAPRAAPRGAQHQHAAPIFAAGVGAMLWNPLSRAGGAHTRSTSAKLPAQRVFVMNENDDNLGKKSLPWVLIGDLSVHGVQQSTTKNLPSASDPPPPARRPDQARPLLRGLAAAREMVPPPPPPPAPSAAADDWSESVRSRQTRGAAPAWKPSPE